MASEACGFIITTELVYVSRLTDLHNAEGLPGQMVAGVGAVSEEENQGLVAIETYTQCLDKLNSC